MQTKTILLIRHAKTQSNAEGRYCGIRSDEGLSEEGKKHTLDRRDAMISLLSKEPAFVVTGPMRRAKETAELLFPKAALRTVKSLSETDFGRFEGKTYEELSSDTEYQKWVDSGGTLPFPDGDARSDFIGRSVEGFKEALEAAGEEGEIVIVCHGGNIMAVMSSLTGGEYYDFRVDNLGGFRLRIRVEDERISVSSYERIGGGDGA